MNKNNNIPAKKSRSARLPSSKSEMQLSKEIYDKSFNARSTVLENLKAEMTQRNLTNAQFFRMFYPLITSESHASLILSGKRPITQDLLVAIHYQWNVTLDEFIADDLPRPGLSLKMKSLICDLADEIRNSENDKDAC